MREQRLVWLLYALLSARLWSTAVSMSVEHSDLSVHAFSSLQAGSSGDSLPPYPEGMELELTCQAAARTTYWYERISPDASPVDFKQLPSRSENPVPGVLLSVYNIPSLKKDDNDRELWCMMDSSTIKKVVHLTVIGPPSPPAIDYSEKEDGLEFKCTANEVDRHLELCWYRGDERLQCKFLGPDEGPPTIVTTYVAGDDLVKGMTLVCRARLKDDRVLETVTKKTRERFTAMLKEASVELKIVGQELPCYDDEPHIETSGIKTFTVRNPDNNLCRKVDIEEHRSTTTTPSTIPMATIKTTSSHEKPVPTRDTNGGSAMAVATLPLLLTLALVVLQ